MISYSLSLSQTLSLYPFLFLSLSLSVCLSLSICLSLSLCVSLYVCVSLCVSLIHFFTLSISPFLSRSLSLFVLPFKVFFCHAAENWKRQKSGKKNFFVVSNFFFDKNFETVTVAARASAWPK
jgi:hypothetical protein